MPRGTARGALDQHNLPLFVALAVDEGRIGSLFHLHHQELRQINCCNTSTTVECYSTVLHSTSPNSACSSSRFSRFAPVAIRGTSVPGRVLKVSGFRAAAVLLSRLPLVDHANKRETAFYLYATCFDAEMPEHAVDDFMPTQSGQGRR